MNETQLFTILKAYLGLAQRPESYEMSDHEWGQLIEYATIHEISAFAFCEVANHKNNLTLQRKAQWALQNVQVKQRSARQLSMLFRLRDLLAKETIPVVVLKGQAYASMYPNPELRQSNDIDFYTVGQFDKVNALLIGQGITISHSDKKHSEMIWEGVMLENHLKMSYDDMNHAHQVVGRYLEHGFDDNYITDPRLPGLNIPEANIGALHLMIHTLSHLAQQNITMRQLLDWVLYLRCHNSALDWQFLDNVWREAGLQRIVGIIARFCEEYLGCQWFMIDYNKAFSDDEYKYVVNDMLHPTLLSTEEESISKEASTMMHDYQRRRRMYGIVYGASYNSGYFHDLGFVFRIKRQLRRLLHLK